MAETETRKAAQIKGPVTAVIVGAGHRSLIYASYALEHPDELRITAVVEPDPVRRRKTAAMHHLREQDCFESIDALLRQPKVADAAINGTMDKIHVPTALPLLEAGYHLLLEKPIGVSQQEVLRLLETARKTGRIVMIGHVLRYAPFYVEIHKRVAAGEIGDIVSIRTTENVSYHHMAAAFVRGKWSRKDVCGSAILMAKCCHDLDIITWLKSGIRPVKVSSLSGRMIFRPEAAPVGAAMRCLPDCKIEEACPYSAYKNYIDQDVWGEYVWHELEHLGPNPTLEQKLESLRTNNPHGRCVWHCDNNVADHQGVLVEYIDGCIANHSLVAGVSKPCRRIHIVGTKGEIQGELEDGAFIVRHPDARKGHEYTEQRVKVEVSGESHGGGDLRLARDFVRVIRGHIPSPSSTNIEDSIYGHIIGFSAERSVEEGRTIAIDSI